MEENIKVETIEVELPPKYELLKLLIVGATGVAASFIARHETGKAFDRWYAKSHQPETTEE